MDKLDIVKALLCDETKNAQPKQSGSFYQPGLVYAFRTVTMVYTGRLVAETQDCFLLEEAAWVAETERWSEFVKNGAHKEAEVYERPVILHKGGMLDATVVPAPIKVSK